MTGLCGDGDRVVSPKTQAYLQKGQYGCDGDGNGGVDGDGGEEEGGWGGERREEEGGWGEEKERTEISMDGKTHSCLHYARHSAFVSAACKVHDSSPPLSSFHPLLLPLSSNPSSQSVSVRSHSTPLPTHHSSLHLLLLRTPHSHSALPLPDSARRGLVIGPTLSSPAAQATSHKPQPTLTAHRAILATAGSSSTGCACDAVAPGHHYNYP